MSDSRCCFFLTKVQHHVCFHGVLIIPVLTQIQPQTFVSTTTPEGCKSVQTVRLNRTGNVFWTDTNGVQMAAEPVAKM